MGEERSRNMQKNLPRNGIGKGPGICSKIYLEVELEKVQEYVVQFT